MKTLQRYNVSSSGEYSSDSGVESKLNTELIEKHTDQQVSEAVQSNSSSEYTTPRDEVSPDVKHINIEHLEPTRMPYVAGKTCIDVKIYFPSLIPTFIIQTRETPVSAAAVVILNFFFFCLFFFHIK